MESRSRVGIVTALAAEARTLGRAVRSGRDLGELQTLSDGSLLAVSGMGFEAAGRSARALVDAGCGALLSWGLAGGLDPRLSPGAVVVPEVTMLDGAPDLPTSSSWRARVLDALSSIRRPVATGGRLLTSRRPVASAAEKRKAFLASGAIAVDMESYAVAHVAATRAFPFIAVRVVVDSADDELPSALLDAADSRGRLAAGRLLVRILASPRALVPSLGLARRFAVARRSLREAALAGAPGMVMP